MKKIFTIMLAFSIGLCFANGGNESIIPKKCFELKNSYKQIEKLEAVSLQPQTTSLKIEGNFADNLFVLTDFKNTSFTFIDVSSGLFDFGKNNHLKRLRFNDLQLYPNYKEKWDSYIKGNILKNGKIISSFDKIPFQQFNDLKLHSHYKEKWHSCIKGSIKKNGKIISSLDKIPLRKLIPKTKNYSC